MITMKEFLEAIEYKITGGSDFGWECYGPNARYLDSDLNDEYSVSCVFDSVDQEIYEVQAWDYRNDRAYRWFAPGCQSEFNAEAKRRGIPNNEASDEMNFTDLEVADDMIEKMSAIVRDEEYDTGVLIPLDFSRDELFELMKMAHERNMSLNDFVNMALAEQIERMAKEHGIDINR